MGERGKRPTPTKLRLLHGETRPSRVNYDEPQPAKMDPKHPDWVDDRTRLVWEHTCYQLRAMGLLAAADQDALLVYCEAVVKYHDAVKLIDASGLLLRGRDGGAVRNPAVQMMRDYGATVRKMAAEFGLTPASRVALRAPDVPQQGADARRLLS